MIIRDAIDDGSVALRRWGSRPLLPAAVVLTLALGLGATIAIFSIASAVLIKPLPWPDPDRLFAVRSVMTSDSAQPAGGRLLTWADWEAMRELGWIERAGIWSSDRMLFGPQRTELVDIAHASSDVLSLLGARPAIGRFFRDEEDQDATPVVLLSHCAWTRRFGGSADALEQPVVLSFNGAGGRQQTFTVIGVLPRDFSIEGYTPEFVLPSGVVAIGWRQSDQLTFNVIAQTRAGTIIPEASEVLAQIAASSGPAGRRTLELRSLSRELLDGSRRALILLFSAAGLLLLVSCSSASGLLLGHAWSRRTEVAVRLSLGAARSRIARQLAVEHALLGVLAAGIGVLLAAWLTPLFIALAPARLPRLDTVAIDLTVVLFALGLGVVASVIFGTAPSLVLAGLSGRDVLTESRALTSRPHTWQQVLVSFQVGLAVVLAISAGLLAGTILRLKSTPLGFESAQLGVVTTTPLSFEAAPLDEARPLPGPRATGSTLTADASAALMRRAQQRLQLGFAAVSRSVIERIAAVPGVSGVAGADAVPFLVRPAQASVRLEGDLLEHTVDRAAVSSDYFGVMGIRLKDGRVFEALDVPGEIAIVSESFERDVAGGSAIGRRFSTTQAPGRALRIVGVVADVKSDLAGPSVPMVYVPLVLVKHFVVRTTGDTAAVLPFIRQALGGSDARVVVTGTTTMQEMLAGSIAEDVFRAALAVLFGGVALVLSLVGVNALVVRWVADRRRDLGIHISLGATPADVRSLVLKRAGFAVAAGIGVGIPGALVAAGILRTYLVGVTAASVVTFVAVPILIAVLALAGAWLPAVRAGRVGPVELMRW